jgi:Divalent cation transporter
VVMETVCPETDHFIGDFDAARRRDAVAQLRSQLSVIAELGGKGVLTPASWGMFSLRLPPFDPPRGEREDCELLTGLLVGTTLAAVFLPVGLSRWGEPDVAVAVALSLLAACSTATLVAMALPWLLHRLGRDPAYGSGPLATVIQDLLSVLIYLVIALNLVR